MRQGECQQIPWDQAEVTSLVPLWLLSRKEEGRGQREGSTAPVKGGAEAEVDPRYLLQITRCLFPPR